MKLSTVSLLPLVLCSTQALNVILTNDDGFETELIQSLFRTLRDAGHDVVMSAPYEGYEGQSGTSGKIDFLRPILPTSEASPGGTLPAGSPGVGPTTVEDKQFYVNGAVTGALLHGIDVLGPQFFGSRDGIDLVLSGPNEGSNTGLLTPHSGTVAAAVTAINKGIPAMAMSATTDEANPELIAQLALKVIDTTFPTLQSLEGENLGFNVNFPTTTDGTTADDYSLVASKIGLNGLVGLEFILDMTECSFASGLPALPGMCLALPITSAGYPEDSDPLSEYNVITGSDNPRQIAISWIDGTYAATLPEGVELDLGEALPSPNSVANPLNIILTNDDGFETPLIQALFFALQNAGHNVVMSAPYEGQSGTSGLIQFLAPLGPTENDSPGGTILAGAPAVGLTTLDGVNGKQFYVAGAVTSAVTHGIDVLAPQFFGGTRPDLVISGPNEGQNTGVVTPHSGTVAAAVTALNKGIPAMAVSADGDEANPELIGALMVKLVENVYTSIPAGFGLNVNFPATTTTGLGALDTYTFVNSVVGRNAIVGLNFIMNLTECAFLGGAGAPSPGMCLGAPIESVGYEADSNALSEFNVFNNDPLAVAVSPIQGTYQADVSLGLTLEPTSAPTMAPTEAPSMATSSAAFVGDSAGNHVVVTLLVWTVLAAVGLAF